MAGLRPFVTRLWRHDPAGVLEAAGLALALAAAQGASVLVLVPLVSEVGVPGGEDAGTLGAVATLVFDRLGLPRELVAVLLLYVGLMTLRALLERRRIVHDGELRLGFVRRLRRELYEAIVRTDARALAASRRSDFLQALTHDVDRVGHAAFSLLRAAVLAVTLGVYLVLALALSVPATLVTCAVGAVLTFLTRGAMASARSTGETLTSRANDLYATAGEHLDGMVEVRSYTAEERSATAFSHAVHGIDATRIEFLRQRATAGFWMATGSALALATILLVAVEVLELPLPSLLILMYVFARALPLLGQLQQTVLEFLNLRPAYDDIEARLADLRSARAPGEERPAPPLTRAVVFDGVSFAYGPEGPALRDVTLTIPAGRTTAVTGASGAGKSTLALLLMAFSPPDSGRILVDGIALEPESQRGWRERIGYVPQEPFLFHETVRENLMWARPDATDDEVWRALESAAAADFVRDAPLGLDTVIGDRGMRLSGGQRQRIALARALLVRPQLLLLDEATNALDPESEARVFEALDRLHGRMTIVLIAHRLPQGSEIDHVVELAAGRVVGGHRTASSGSEPIR